MIHALPSETDWTSSSYSQGNGGECVEWAPAHTSATGVVPVRDSKNPTGPTLMVTPTAFAGLVALARAADL
ncbi:hypothetical protein GCM10010387_02730 [Streptomyces inusitatus]|uniref:DUF397 domain-containing protein n=1 Tax=Streptomyces inusitatus TaxID=68221 RepID=A0A918UJH1_9ACTN|nr:DUF397 domain-containing protein [Streptomyces inusitatus]GGZ14100.1 hypothetical protein GCM10010387_02730 [Streptomyces inusitatus]